MKKLFIIFALLFSLTLALVSCGGKDGEKGDTGATIKEVSFDADGRLVITLTDGTVLPPVELPEKEEHIHTFGEWTTYGADSATPCEERLSYRICSECKTFDWKEGKYEDHNFLTVTTAPTCTDEGFDTKTCSICGRIEICNETPVSDHPYPDEYATDSSFHWKECPDCESTTAKVEHSLGEDGICTTCSAVVGATEGIIYDLAPDGSYASVVGYSGTAKRIKIAEEYMGAPVTEICDSAFEDCNITSVIIPDSVTKICDSAFWGCSQLEGVYITDITAWCNIYFEEIDSNPLSYANNLYLNGELLTELVIPEGVTDIGDYAFYNCSSLKVVIIGNNVTSIGEQTFEYCKSLERVTIGNSVTYIGYEAFGVCSSLTNITIPDSVTYIGAYAFSACNSELYTEYEFGRYIGNEENPYAVLVEITNKNLSSYKINESTKVLANSVFEECTRLASITIPDSVTSIGDYAFKFCSSLTSVTIGDSVESIGYSAFGYCTSLTSVTIGESVTSIGNDAFYDCQSLKNVAFGNSVTYIGYEAFYRCSSLKEIILPDSVTSIGEWAFAYCSSLAGVTIPDSVTYIGNYAFSGCFSLTIYCEAESKPSGWDYYWSSSNCPVVWGYKD